MQTLSASSTMSKKPRPLVTDPDFANVVFLSYFEGSDGAKAAIDESNSSHIITFEEGAEIDTAQSKFGNWRKLKVMLLVTMNDSI